MNGKSWGLTQSPFRGEPDLANYYANTMHDEALARLEYLVDQRRRVGLLLGDSGTGKSLLLSILAHQLSQAGRPVIRLSMTGMGSSEFPWLVAAGLGLAPRETDGPVRLWRMISDQITANRFQEIGTTLLLDDVDQASPEVTLLVLRLMQCDQSVAAMLTVVLSANSKSAGHISKYLVELADLRVDLEPWDTATTSLYLSSAIVRSGLHSSLLSAKAAERIFQLAGGIPCRVIQLADLVLLAAAGEGLSAIDAETVDTVSDQLSCSQIEYAAL